MRNGSRAFVIACLALVGVSAVAEGEGLASSARASEPADKYQQIRKDHWAFQPVQTPAVPKNLAEGWAKPDIDRFVFAELEKHDLSPSKPADRRTLLRRATFDLTGLPPTPEEVEAFVNDSSSKAFAKVVDRLLASPAFGERWGRHWLDVARYAESTGMTRNAGYFYAWRYRDYVIDALNADKPFDRFVREQLAGDLLPYESGRQRDEQLIATGFLAIGPKDLNERNPLQYTLNNVDEQLDATSRAFLGMTVACARCHDHKFDPIPTSEYYALAGIFRSTELQAGVGGRRGQRDFYKPDALNNLSASVDDNDGARRGKSPVAGAGGGRGEVDVAVSRLDDDGDDAATPQQRRQREQLRRRLQQQQRLGGGRNAEANIRPVAMGVKDGRLPADSKLFLRGEVDEPGPVVPRGTITLPGMRPIGPIPADRSGRLELADWVASPTNPLTARVMVNRIWQHLLGDGLVTTVDNFGTTGEPPSHPELLDHLAATFVADGWSVKRAIKRIMLSGVYQQAGAFDEAKFAVDPDNRWLWRASPRRLEAEAIRDAMLAAAGTLDRERPRGSAILKLPAVDLSRAAQFAGPRLNDTRARSVYLPVIRDAAPPVLDVFDLADNAQVTGCRDVTTVAPQALFMMNDPFVLEQSRALAARVTRERTSTEQRVDRAYALTLGRVPSDAERQRAIKYVREFEKSAATERNKPKTAEADAWAGLCQALFASAEFRYVN